jgi:putative PIN family toxin of toxin-antitoxin system
VRIVIDTNIWISGLLWRGLSWNLLRLAEADQVELCMAPAMLVELAEVLSYKRLQPRLEQLDLTSSELLAYAANLASFFEVPEGDPVVTADPDDDVFVHCAVAAGADFIVPGDRHLLDLGHHADIPILAIREFISQAFPDHLD